MSKYTKKDYLTIADEIAKSRLQTIEKENMAVNLNVLIDNIATMFENDNPDFDRERFLIYIAQKIRV